MSYTTVYAVCFRTSVEEIAELRNAWGSAPVVWDAMCQRYLGRESWRGDDKPLWALARDPRVPECERAVHAMTFDRAYVKAADIPQAIEHVQEFLDRNPVSLERENHWPKIIELMKGLGEGCGIAFHMTSVSADDYWRGEWNEDIEDYDDPDWDKMLDVYEYIS